MRFPREIPSIYVAVGAAILVLLGGGAAYASYSKYEMRAAADAFERDLMNERLMATEAENEKLRTLLQEEAAENEEFGRRVAELSSTVGYLDKLSKTDRELLQKYSPVYFLSENFVPDPLAPIDDELLARHGSNMMIHGQVFPFLKRMMEAAANNGVPLKVLSAYRSFGTQSALKANYKVTYGAGTANQFSADQGYSEHQLGSTVDFTTPEAPENLAAFRGSPQYNWLVSHAHEYGFVLSYPEGNSYFVFEPWHWRFVGIDLATRLYHENKYFYDLDQREINPYLARIFDE
ncbi:MAG TPA: M15 family metallopeptidase [Candidatus Paceibacterota bacterium]|nr:M15 family metallopeptidase [Candidatus Paceibacterota bacterium]